MGRPICVFRQFQISSSATSAPSGARCGCGLMQLTLDRARVDAHRFYESFGVGAIHVGDEFAM